MRKLIVLTLSTLALAGPYGTVAAQDNRPAVHRGNGTEIANNFQFLNEDRARLQNGQWQRGIQDARQNVEAYTKLRAREGRPVTPR